MYDKMPKYAELYAKLKQAISLGEYPAGSFLPTENELMELYQVSKTTVRHAIKLLRENGLVDVKQGSGTKILTPPQENVTGAKYQNPGAKTTVSVQYTTSGPGEITNTKAAADLIPASETVAAALKIAPGDMVYRFQRLQLVDQNTFGYMVNYISKEIAPELPAKGDLATRLYDHLETNYGIHITELTETVDAISAGFMEAQYLQVELNAPLIVLKRIAAENERIIEYCETIVRPDLFHMVIHMDHPMDGMHKM